MLGNTRREFGRLPQTRVVAERPIFLHSLSGQAGRGERAHMAKSLQGIVDSLGKRLSRPVALDDHRMGLLAYNSHFGRVDEVRATSILHRRASSRVIGWVNNQGIRTAVSPV